MVSSSRRPVERFALGRTFARQAADWRADRAADSRRTFSGRSGGWTMKLVIVEAGDFAKTDTQVDEGGAVSLDGARDSTDRVPGRFTFDRFFRSARTASRRGCGSTPGGPASTRRVVHHDEQEVPGQEHGLDFEYRLPDVRVRNDLAGGFASTMHCRNRDIHLSSIPATWSQPLCLVSSSAATAAETAPGTLPVVRGGRGRRSPPPEPPGARLGPGPRLDSRLKIAVAVSIVASSVLPWT